MKKPMFDDWDHFKGDFKSRPKPVEKKKKDYYYRDACNYIYANINSSYGRFGKSNFMSLQTEYNKMMSDVLIYGQGSMNVFGEEIIFSGPIECDHEPIDVGFAKPKMVCKKCDKDL